MLDEKKMGLYGSDRSYSRRNHVIRAMQEAFHFQRRERVSL